MKLRYLILLLAAPLMAQTPGARHDNVAYSYANTNGIITVQTIPGAVITVCNGLTLPSPGAICTVGGNANIFSNNILTIPLPNPTNADSLGNYGFFVAPGNYIVSVSAVGLTTYSYPLKLPCPADSNCTVTGNWTFTGTVNIPAGLGLVLPLSLSKDGFVHTLTAPLTTAARVWTLQNVSDTFVFLSTVDTLSNKTFNVSTFDISVNTLKNGTNTAGHYIRNNGTQYVDVPLSTVVADVNPSIVGGTGCSAGNYATGFSSLLNLACAQVQFSQLGGVPTGLSTFQVINDNTTVSCSGDQAVCSHTYTWPSSFGSAAYTAVCTPKGAPNVGSNQGLALSGTLNQTATTIDVAYVSSGSASKSFTGMTCWGVHN